MLTLILNSMEGPLQAILAAPHQGDAPSKLEGGPCPASPACPPLYSLAEGIWEAPAQGAETLIPELAKLLASHKVTPAQISRIACVRGPGSFTGIRLILTTALGLARSCPAKPTLAGLDYLPLLATTAAHYLKDPSKLPRASEVAGACGAEQKICLFVLTHARRGQVHSQGFTLQGNQISALTKASGQTIENALQQIEQRYGEDTGHTGHSTHTGQTDLPLYLTGSGALRNQDAFLEHFPRAVLLPERLALPSSTSLLLAAAKASYSPKPIEPLYLRACDAEENLPYIAAGLGLDPHKAMLELLELTGRQPLKGSPT